LAERDHRPIQFSVEYGEKFLNWYRLDVEWQLFFKSNLVNKLKSTCLLLITMNHIICHFI